VAVDSTAAAVGALAVLAVAGSAAVVSGVEFRGVVALEQAISNSSSAGLLAG